MFLCYLPGHPNVLRGFTIFTWISCCVECFSNLPGHPAVLHVFDSEADPEQVFPPYLGVGLVQPLFLALVPPPHDLVQLLHLAHAANPPLTVKKM